MNRDIALAGFVLTAEEWQALDPASRAELLAAAFRDQVTWIGPATANSPNHPANQFAALSGNGQSQS